jgi:hypothetical protein
MTKFRPNLVPIGLKSNSQWVKWQALFVVLLLNRRNKKHRPPALEGGGVLVSKACMPTYSFFTSSEFQHGPTKN